MLLPIYIFISNRLQAFLSLTGVGTSPVSVTQNTAQTYWWVVQIVLFLPSNQRKNRTGRGSKVNRGRGLLDTPYVSPWQQNFGFEDYVNSTYQQYMKGVQKVEQQVRAKIGKMCRPQVYSSRTRHQQYPDNLPTIKPAPNGKSDMWLGKGRGQVPDVRSKVVPNNDATNFGRGQWLNASE